VHSFDTGRIHAIQLEATRVIVFEPLDFIARLAALVPKPH